MRSERIDRGYENWRDCPSRPIDAKMGEPGDWGRLPRNESEFLSRRGNGTLAIERCAETEILYPPEPRAGRRRHARRTAQGSGLRPGVHRPHGDHPLADGRRLVRRADRAARADPDGSGRGRAALRAGDLRGAEGLPARRRRRRPVPPGAPTPAGSASRPRGWRCRSCPRNCSSGRSTSWSRSTATGCPTAATVSLYLRPFMFASEVFLGVRPSAEYLFISSPPGRLLLQGRRQAGDGLGLPEYTRAAPGGTGAAKCGGNYAASLVAAGRGDRARLRPGGLPRRRRAAGGSTSSAG